MIKKNLTRKDLSKKINHSIGLSKNLSLQIIESFFELLILELVKYNKIKISSFGTFDVLAKGERTGRNPKTKVEAKISSRRVVRFKASHLLKEKINHNE